MAGKFHRSKKSAFASRKKKSATLRPRPAGTLATSILTLLHEQTQPLAMEEIVQALALGHSQLSSLHKALGTLLDAHQIEKRGKRFAPVARPEPLRATLELTSKGVGFAVLNGEQAQKGKDIFIAPHNLNGASHGDTVLLALLGTERGRREGRVVQVVQRAVTQLCGIFTLTSSGGYVNPDDDRLPYTVSIRRQDTLSAGDGEAVLVEITDYGSERQGPSGRIVEVLGDVRDAGVQIRMAIRQLGLREHFPAEVLTEAAALQAVSQCEPGRVDLRHLAHVTIDGESARDFDDAICVETSSNGYTLYVSIADVSHYVTTGSAIDREAYQRGTSVYLPDRVLPMLPERLSNDLCSLVPDEDRPAFTAILQFDHQGRRIGERYHKSLIRSRQRFTYTIVNRLVYQQDAQTRTSCAELLPMLEQAAQLTALLRQRRSERGSLEFNIPEPEVRLAGNRVASIALAERNQAHQLIEDCMLAANEAVAETLDKMQRPVLFRIHEKPDPMKLETFTDAAKALGMTLPRSEVNPAWFAEIIGQAAGSPMEYIVNTLLLRTMQQARYSPDNAGHFGLAAPYYLHFTSPIRRYPDLVAHRVLQAWLHKLQAPAIPGADTNLLEAGLHLSQCERKAIDAERNVHARCSALFLLDRIGETFIATISGVTGFGLYLTLDETYISGMVPLTSMIDDYYLHDSRRYRLIGETSNRMYQLGNRVEVRLEQVDLAAKRISFSLVAKISDKPSEKGEATGP